MTCRQSSLQYNNVFRAFCAVNLQITVNNFTACIFRSAEIVELIRRREIVFRSRVYHGFIGVYGIVGGVGIYRRIRCVRRIACIFNSNFRNLPVRFRIANVTELQSQTRTVFRNIRHGSNFTIIPQFRGFPSGIGLTIKLHCARSHCAPGPEAPAVNDFANHFAIYFHHSASLQGRFQHENGIEVFCGGSVFKIDGRKLQIAAAFIFYNFHTSVVNVDKIAQLIRRSEIVYFSQISINCIQSMVACRSYVRAVRNGRARSFRVKVPTQEFGKRFFGIVGDNHCAVHTAEGYRLVGQRSFTVYRSPIQLVRNGIRFALPNGIQRMIAFAVRNDRIRRDGIAFTIGFRVPTNKDIAFVFHFYHGKFAVGFTGRYLDVFRIVYGGSKV